MLKLWIRQETRDAERRCPLSPAHAARLIGQGAHITVEESPQRIYPLSAFADRGCVSAAAGSWADAPRDTVVLGLKELPDEPCRLRHRHVYFGHAYKGQPGARRLLDRFRDGGGMLLDLEQLTDDAGRRHAAFGFWAGFAGAALGVLHLRGDLDVPVRRTNRTDLVGRLRARRRDTDHTALVVGARGRSGHGAVAALAEAGIRATQWDLAETRQLDRAAVLAHDLLINAVLADAGTEPLLYRHDIDRPHRRLRCAVDVSCDAGSPWNALPIYDALTTWDAPVTDVGPVAVIAIDNLPSLLPREASDSFSADLSPHLAALDGLTGPWQRCADAYHRAVRDLATSGGR